MNLTWKIISFTAVVASSSVLLLMVLKYAKRKKKNLQKKRVYARRNPAALDVSNDWESVGSVKGLFLYPIKSCSGLNLKSARADKLGLVLNDFCDRSLMIVDENNVMVTGRKVSSMVLVSAVHENDQLVLRFPRLQPLSVDLSLIKIDGEVKICKLWDEEVSGLDCGGEVSDWLSVALGLRCFLIYHGPFSSQRLAEHVNHPMMEDDDCSRYADLTSYMLMTESSLKDLQKRTTAFVHPRNFRPNILIEGLEPYDEDNWTYIRIGSTIFRNVSPCERCVFTTINYETGERDKRMEPLKTMKRYRCFEGNSAPHFGINLGLDRSGTINVGDLVEVLKR